METRAGLFVTVPGLGYKAFEPTKLPPKNLEIDEKMLGLISEASMLLGRLDGLSAKIPNVDLFVSSYVRKEALMSSQIEGTQTSLVDVLDPNIEKNTNLNVLDVVNYTNAVNYAIERLKTLPLCNALLKETHAILLSGTRGEEKNPGEFRKSQNWIGAAGCTISNARFIPPTPYNMLECMSDLEKFINNDDDINPLIKIALIHYQFETIHPFLDGNGRLGRMLIVLYLLDRKILTYPVFYISYFLKKNRIEYYDRLAEVREKGNYEQWIKFFVEAVIETCKDSLKTITELNDMNERDRKKIAKSKKSTLKLYNYILINPIIETKKTASELGLSYNTIASAIRELCEFKILKESGENKRNKTYHYEDCLNILKRDTENI